MTVQAQNGIGRMHDILALFFYSGKRVTSGVHLHIQSYLTSYGRLTKYVEGV